MTDRTIIEAVERVIANIQADRDFWSRYNQAPCYYQLTSSPEDAMIIQTVLEDWLYGTENSPSDARKGDGWSTISVDENAGANGYPKNVRTYVGDKAVCTIVVDKDKEDLLRYLVNVLNIVDGVAR